MAEGYILPGLGRAGRQVPKLVDGGVAFVEWSEWRIPAPLPAGSTWKCGAEGDEAIAAPGGSGGDPPRPTPPVSIGSILLQGG